MRLELVFNIWQGVGTNQPAKNSRNFPISICDLRNAPHRFDKLDGGGCSCTFPGDCPGVYVMYPLAAQRPCQSRVGPGSSSRWGRRAIYYFQGREQAATVTSGALLGLGPGGGPKHLSIRAEVGPNRGYTAPPGADLSIKCLISGSLTAVPVEVEN